MCCVMVYGVSCMLCACLCLRVLDVFVCVDCGFMCDVVYLVWSCVFVCVLLLFDVVVCVDYEPMCGVVWLALLCAFVCDVCVCVWCTLLFKCVCAFCL